MAYRFTYKFTNNENNSRQHIDCKDKNLIATSFGLSDDKGCSCCCRTNKTKNKTRNGSTESISNLINKIFIDESNAGNKVSKKNDNFNLYIHSNFMDAIELAYLLDFYVNENNNGLNNFCCFFFGTKKSKENSKSIKSVVIPNEYIHEFKFNLIQIVNNLTAYIRSMYKCYSTFEFIGWMCTSAKLGFDNRSY